MSDITSETVAQMVAWLRGSARRLTECTFADAADMLTALATQLAERDAELARVTAQRDHLAKIDVARDGEHRDATARIAALTEALRHYAGDPSSSGIVARAALTTDKEPNT